MSLEWGVCDPPPGLALQSPTMISEWGVTPPSKFFFKRINDPIKKSYSPPTTTTRVAGKNAVYIRTYTYSACCVLQAAAKDMSRCLSLRCGIAMFFFTCLIRRQTLSPSLATTCRPSRGGIRPRLLFLQYSTNSKMLLYNFKMIVGKLGGEFAFSTMGDCVDSFLSGGPDKQGPFRVPQGKGGTALGCFGQRRMAFASQSGAGYVEYGSFWGEGVMGGEFGLWTH